MIMKRSYFIAIFTVILLVFNVNFNLQAQKPVMKFGKIDPANFELKTYDKDTSAEALILGDYGESQIIYDQNVGFVVEYSRHFRAKIFKKSGYDLANQELILYHNANGQEKILTLKGSVYNMENGKVIESTLEKSMIFQEEMDNRHTEQKFTLPNVREGSILEFYYKVRSDFWSLPDWQFQHDIPALWSEYRVSYPEYFYFKKLQKGYLIFSVSEEDTKPVTFTITETTRAEGMLVKSSTEKYQVQYMDHVFRWVQNDVPAFREEPFMNAMINYQSALEFELASYKPPAGMVNNYTQTWEKINEDLMDDEDFGLQLKRGGFLKDVVTQLKVPADDQVKQMIAAFNFVRNTMKWDNRNRVYLTQNLRNVFEKKAGSSADINLLLVTLLRELGLQSNPVILSTRNNGAIHPAQIMVNQFNYVIASVNIGDKTYLLDATEKDGSYNLLPPRCINGQGRIISETKTNWIDLNPAQRYEFTNVIKATIGSDGLITGNMQRSFGNYAALNKRIEIRGSKDNDEYIRKLESSNKGLTVQKYELVGIDSLSKPYKENLDVEISDYAQIAGNIISLTPLLYDQWSSNPFKLEDRKFPVDFTYPHIYKDIINYTIPDGYVLDEKPADLVMSLPDGKTKFSYRMRVDGNTIQISSTLDIGKSLYTYDEYVSLKEFFAKLVSKQAEKVVLKKSI
jgi:hypothetical protein